MHDGPCSDARRLLDLHFDLRGHARCDELRAEVILHRIEGAAFHPRLAMHIGAAAPAWREPATLAELQTVSTELRHNSAR